MLMPSTGSESRAEPPPETRTSRRSSFVSALRAPQDFLRRLLAAFVRHRVGGLDHSDAAGEQPVLVTGDDEPVERSARRPVPLHRQRHRGGSLACAHYQRAS